MQWTGLAGCLQRAAVKYFARAIQPSTGATALRHAEFATAAKEATFRTSKLRLVVLGSGWAASSLAKNIDTSRYSLTVVSELNHLVFTPMLPGAAVGTVEERSTAISIFGIKPSLKVKPNRFLTGRAIAVDPKAKKVSCEDALGGAYELSYDILAVATGAQGSTFGTPGVEENALFLRNVQNASAIRNALIRNWQLARSPGQDSASKKRLLTTLIVGGGPTGVEFAGELSDLISTELRAIDGARARDAKVLIVEAQELLGSFDAMLRGYAASRLRKQGIEIIEKGIVKEVLPREVVLDNGRRLPYGLCVWSTGVGPTAFTTSLPFARTARGRLAVDERLRVLVEPSERSAEGAGPASEREVDTSRPEHHEAEMARSAKLQALDNVYALGDCSANIGTPLPALAQVAEQQGRYLARALNQRAAPGDDAAIKPFVWRRFGAMATLGSRSAIIELGDQQRHINWRGFSSYLAWKSAYLSKLYTFRSRFQILTNWISTAVFGRDVSRW